MHKYTAIYIAIIHRKYTYFFYSSLNIFIQNSKAYIKLQL